MKKRLNEISGYLKVEKLRNDKRIVVFLVCLFIATALWFLNALSKDYTTSIFYPVKYVNPPKNQFLSNAPPSKLELKVEAHGFTLLRHKLNLSFSPIVLNLTNITRNTTPGADGYYISTNSLLRRISDQVSNEISISAILPEYLTIKLDSLKSKKVPVQPNLHLSYMPQFSLKEPVSVNPRIVEITGPAAILDTINALKTEKKEFEKLDNDVERYLSIVYPEKTTIKPEKVILKISVEKFTEKEVMVPVEVLNSPDDAIIKLFPSEVKLTFLVGLSKFGDIRPSDFKIAADFDKIDVNAEKLAVEVLSKPSFVESVRIFPASIEYLVEKHQIIKE